jgi:hypothetical protein
MANAHGVRLAILFPILHVFACAVVSIGFFVERLQGLGIGWVFLNFIDFPVSIVALAIGWHHQIPGLVFYVIVGTWWWYFLGGRIDKGRGSSVR